MPYSPPAWARVSAAWRRSCKGDLETILGLGPRWWVAELHIVRFPRPLGASAVRHFFIKMQARHSFWVGLVAPDTPVGISALLAKMRPDLAAAVAHALLRERQCFVIDPEGRPWLKTATGFPFVRHGSPPFRSSRALSRSRS